MPWYTGQTGCGCCGDSGGGGETGVDCPTCDSGKAPTYFNLEVSGIVTNTAVYTNPLCDGWCEANLNGTFQVPWSPFTDMGGNVTCRWFTCLDITDSPFAPRPDAPLFNNCSFVSPNTALAGPSQQFRSMSIEILFDLSLDEIYASIGLFVTDNGCLSNAAIPASGYGIHFAPLSGTSPYDCETDLTPQLTLQEDPFLSQNYSANLCLQNSATFKLQGFYT